MLEKGKERLNKNPSIFGYILDPNDEKEKLMHLAEKILNLKKQKYECLCYKKRKERTNKIQFYNRWNTS